MTSAVSSFRVLLYFILMLSCEQGRLFGAAVS